MDIDEYLKAVAEGDITALEVLYQEMNKAIYALSFAIVRDKQIAEDVLQETFLRIYDNASKYKPGTNAKAWILSIARNLTYDALRMQKHTVSDADLEEDASNDNAEIVIIDKIMLENALLELSGIERQIVILHVIGGLKHHEVAEIVGVLPDNVRQKYRQALKKLMKKLGGRIDETTESLRRCVGNQE